MQQKIAYITLLVKDYDEAIAFYTQKLAFKLIEDTPIDDTKRWVLIAPSGSQAVSILLTKATTEKQIKTIGNQAGGAVFLILHTADFWRDYHSMNTKGVRFVQAPKEETYGTVAIFEDLYGNLWDLIQPIT
jgi:catechol 2,3-dioxygenase-like lactoylglutathione lyase family enzyme